MRLTAQILTQTDFSDKTKLLELIRQQRDGLQQQWAQAGAENAARQQQLPMHVEDVHARWQPHPNIQRIHRNEWRSAHGAIVNLYAPLRVGHCWS